MEKLLNPLSGWTIPLELIWVAVIVLALGLLLGFCSATVYWALDVEDELEGKSHE